MAKAEMSETEKAPGKAGREAPKREHIAMLAALGRRGDDKLGHLSHGDIVIPREKVNPTIRQMLRSAGVPMRRFTVGYAANSINPATGLPEFAGGDGGGNSDGPGSGAGGAGSGGGGAAGSGAGAAGGVGDPVGGPTASDPSTGSTTGPAQGPGGLSVGGLGQSSGLGPGAPTPGATHGEEGTGHALGPSSVTSGMMGGFGQPTSGISSLDGMINGFVTDPVGTLAALGINLGLGFAGPAGLAANLGSRGLTGQSVGSNIVGAIEGQGLGQGGLAGIAGLGGLGAGATGSAPTSGAPGGAGGEAGTDVASILRQLRGAA